MRKYLLPEQGNFYKANLHCHSTFSDGKHTPEEIKAAYIDKGYSVVAFTDHDVFITHNALSDEKFLALNGYEIDAAQSNEQYTGGMRKLCHLCFVALEPDNDIQVCWHRSSYLHEKTEPHKDKVHFDQSLPDYERKYSSEGISDMIRIGREGGFFVTYNHPAWSNESSAEYLGYNGMHAMEICNYGTYVDGYEGYCPYIYDEMLRAGKRIYCISTDDNHSFNQSFGGFTVIKADKLEYREITRAMEAGNMYASMGPEIYDLYVEDGKVHVKCSPAKQIYMITGMRYGKGVRAPEGELITEAVFPLRDDLIYFRINVLGPDGMPANTRAYFIDEL